MADLPPVSGYLLPLASLPDGALALVLSFGTVAEIVTTNVVCRSWNLHGNRVDLWQALGETFEVSMPISLRPQSSLGAPAGTRPAGKRFLRSSANAKRTFFKSYATARTTHRLNHDAVLSEAYTLFRMQDSVPRLRFLLRRRWDIALKTANQSASRSSVGKGAGGKSMVGVCSPESQECPGGDRDGALRTKPTGSSGSSGGNSDGRGSEKRKRSVTRGSSSNDEGINFYGVAWRGKKRWSLDVNHRHGILEGNTMLNFAVRCGRRKCVDFLVTQMGANVEIPDEGGFTPLLNTAWRGDTGLLKQLLASGARLDVKGVSRGNGPYGPLEWAERKGRLETAAFLRRLVAGDGGNKEMSRTLKPSASTRKRGTPGSGGAASAQG